MLDLTLQIVIFRALALLPIAAVHGVAIAGTAYLLGDHGPRFDGRLTPGPLPHLDLVGGLGVVIFGLGWIRPVAIDAAKLRTGRAGLVLITTAGIAANLALADVLQLLRLPVLGLSQDSLGLTAVAFLDLAAGLSVWFAVFNLIPLPPLTGGLILRAIAPQTTRWLARYAVILIVIIAAFAVSGVARTTLAPVYDFVANRLLH